MKGIMTLFEESLQIMDAIMKSIFATDVLPRGRLMIHNTNVVRTLYPNCLEGTQGSVSIAPCHSMTHQISQELLWMCFV